MSRWHRVGQKLPVRFDDMCREARSRRDHLQYTARLSVWGQGSRMVVGHVQGKLSRKMV